MRVLRFIHSFNNYFTSIYYLPGTLLGTGSYIGEHDKCLPQGSVHFLGGTLRSVQTEHSRRACEYYMGYCFSCWKYNIINIYIASKEFWVLLVQHTCQSSIKAWRGKWWTGSDWISYKNWFWTLGKDSLITSLKWTLFSHDI